MKMSLFFPFIMSLLVLAPISTGNAGPGELDYVVITPESAKVAMVGSTQFTAKGYDEADSELAELTFKWSVVNGGGSINADGLFTAGMESGFYENTIQVEATQDDVTKVAYASVTIVKLLDVEVTISELPAADGYLYTCVVENIGIEVCDSFVLGYSGDEPIDHSQPRYWTYKPEAGKISWQESSVSENFAPGETRGFYFTIPQRSPKIDWKAKNTRTGNFDFGLVEVFVDTMLSPLDVDVKASADKMVDGYLYTLIVHNIGEEICDSFSIRYSGGGGEPIDQSQPPYWTYKAEAGKISWQESSVSENFAPGEMRSFYFTIPQRSPQTDWKAKNTTTGNLDIGLVEGGPPSIAQVTPDIGVAGQVVTLTGANFVEGATVTFGGIPANVSAVSATEITLTAPAGYEDVWVDISVRNPDGSSATRAKAFRYYSDLPVIEIIPDFTAQLELMQGINMISLPLNSDFSYTASTLADTLNSTIVIQVKDGGFDAYVHAGGIGNDFDIKMGNGYIVNLMEAQTFEITGKPWGEPIPSAPYTSTPTAPWAFVIAGQIDGFFGGLTPEKQGGQLRATNLRTGESITVPISPSGEFTAAFVDMNRKSVVEAGDTIITQIIGAGNAQLTKAKRYTISHKEIAHAYLLTHLSVKPERSRLLQNYPNPFNPETWIPYQLAKPADVTIHIYNASGQLIRTLSLRQKNTGFYIAPSKAAYWNGRNASGERVASGIYFYQFTAGDFRATRRMVIVK